MTHTLNNEQLNSLLKTHENKKDIVIIDIREPNEYAKEHIANSINVPLRELEKYDFSQHEGKAIIFHCKSGIRTRSAQSQLATIGIKDVYCLEGGIEQWKQCGMKTLLNKRAPIEIMRQVQIAAGILILLGIALSYLVTPLFIALSALVGFGLIFAGLTGICGMAKLLFYMPWNK